MSDTNEQVGALPPAPPLVTPMRRAAHRRRRVVICLALFLLALGVRFFHWQDNRPAFVFNGMFAEYKAHALLLTHGDLRRFLAGNDPPSDADVVKHPPGYPLFLAAVYTIFGESDVPLRAVHITLDATACVLLFLIALELFGDGVAVVAGLLVALSPQLAYHAIALLPDPLAPLPLLVAFYLLVRALKRPRLRLFVVAGALIGVSCWLRSNALLLPLLLACLIMFIFPRERRVRYALALLCAAVVVMLPVTIRNYVAFHHFIPLSLSAGITLVEGIGVYDKEKRFGLPDNDNDVTKWEAEMYHRPDYLCTRFKPDGVWREQARVRQGLAVIRQHPFWFSGVVLRRAADMLRFMRVERIAADPAVAHTLAPTDNSAPTLTLTPAELQADGDAQAQATLTPDQRALRLTGDGLATLFVTPPLAAQPRTDYLLRLPLKVEQGSVVIEVLDGASGALLAATPILHPSVNYCDPTLVQQPSVPILRPFVNADAQQVRVRLRNGDRHNARVVAEVGALETFALQPATQTWTRYPRTLLRAVQKFFLTAWLLPFVFGGAFIMWHTKQRRALVLLGALPLYYMCVQSLLWTEFRYIIAMHYPVLLLAALALHTSGAWLWQQAQRLRRTTRA